MQTIYVFVYSILCCIHTKLLFCELFYTFYILSLYSISLFNVILFVFKIFRSLLLVFFAKCLTFCHSPNKFFIRKIQTSPEQKMCFISMNFLTFFFQNAIFPAISMFFRWNIFPFFIYCCYCCCSNILIAYKTRNRAKKSLNEWIQEKKNEVVVVFSTLVNHILLLHISIATIKDFNISRIAFALHIYNIECGSRTSLALTSKLIL